MKKKSMIVAEWKQLLRTRKMLVPMIAILFIPVLYAGMFLWAFWDPYANMGALPVAIVNLDEGAEMDGEQLALGDELVDKLMNSGNFNIQNVSQEVAEEGLKNQDYYIAIEIPENFSQHATTLLDENPEKLTIVYKPNEGFNFLSAQIGETAMDRIRAEVNEKIASTYAEQLFDSIDKMGNGFGEAADGAGKLHDGATELENGARDLKGYLETLASSTVSLKDGSDRLAKGTNDAAKGAADLNKGIGALSAGVADLNNGAAQASKGASDLKAGIASYTAGVEQLRDSYALIAQKENEFGKALSTINEKTVALNGAAQQLGEGSKNVSAGINDLSDKLAPVLASLPEEQQAALKAALGQLKQGSAELSDGMAELSNGTAALQEGTAQLDGAAAQLRNGHAQALAGITKLNGSSAQLSEGAAALEQGNGALAAGLEQLSEGVAAAQKGSSDLASGLNELNAGSNTLREGTGTLATKSKELADGSSKLTDGMKELNEGTLTLKEKLAEANEAASEVNPNEKTYEMAAAPVDVAKDGINEVPNYGTGFAPYFLSLGLFVGALLLSIVFPLVEPAIKPTNAFSWMASKVSVLAIVGLIQALVAVAIIKWGLGMETVNLPLFILTAIITSYTFIAIVQMLVSLLGDPGRFAAILILILQLTTSAGTFPLELIPGPLQVFNTLLPMTYSVQAFKASISTGDIAHLWANNGVLIGFMVACLAITFGYFALIFKKRYSRNTVEA
ncbi:YhgE/Pip domain-containing protein [Sporosarcina highlanderae]|uniref:YhgE/Pip domain-containing protein n=1 Tax=Sporosarcina highlanderae TaxID=3035916 RepID=A0ABT8JMC0_9BACL|nr:YhgE/Pip domain-containing protein [Sporosarcina highlanderae]MDN4606097.1 YhgE/Pip domain-containing protein [Sporosarcina highlanderae]